MTALLTALGILAALILCLFGWCLATTQIFLSDHDDPVGDVIFAWWLAVAWVRGWLGGEIDSHNCAEDV